MEGDEAMSEPQFFQTRMGKVFYEATMPNLVKQLARLNELLERLVKRMDHDEES